MISNQLMQHITQVRRTDNDSSSRLNDLFKIDGTQYYPQLQLLLQEADRLQLKNTTKFLAKKYFDMFLSKYPNTPEQKIILVIITCLRTAVKFNQTVQISEPYNMQFCMEQSSGRYSIQNFIYSQIQLLKALNFKLRYTTPYDFIFIKSLLPHLNQAINLLNLTIDFALSLPELRVSSAEAIFFGALIYCCRKQNQKLISFEIIHAITFKWQQANQISYILEQNLKLLTQE